MKQPNEQEIKIVLDLLAQMHGAVPNAKGIVTVLAKPLLDTADMAYLFQKSKPTIHRWRKKGFLPAKEIQKNYYFERSKVLKLIGWDNAA